MAANRLPPLKELHDDLKQLYEDLAARYDHHLLVECCYRTPHAASQFLRDQLPQAQGLWLEVGAGTGLVGHELNLGGFELRLVALDLSRAMLAQVSAPNYVACCEANLESDGTFAADTFDGAIAIGVFDHLEDPSRALDAVGKMLRPSAFWLLSFSESAQAGIEEADAEVHLFRHSAPWFKHRCEQAGFVVRAEQLVDGYVSYGETVKHRLLLLQRPS